MTCHLLLLQSELFPLLHFGQDIASSVETIPHCGLMHNLSSEICPRGYKLQSYLQIYIHLPTMSFECSFVNGVRNSYPSFVTSMLSPTCAR